MALDRTVDRALQDTIEELTRQLTPLGKLELAVRLTGEAVADALVAFTTPPLGGEVLALESGSGGLEEARKQPPAVANVEPATDDAFDCPRCGGNTLTGAHERWCDAPTHEEDTHDG